MSPSKFIEAYLLTNPVEGLQNVFYEYHDYSETHFLKIIPENIADADEHQLALSKLIIAFEYSFPNEMLCIIGKNSLTQLENPIELILPISHIENVFFTGEQLKHNIFETGIGINTALITIDKTQKINTQISCINWCFTETENDYKDLGYVAEPMEEYKLANDNDMKYLPQAA